MKKKAKQAGKFTDNLWNVALLLTIAYAAVAVVFGLETPKMLTYIVGGVLGVQVVFELYRLQSK